MKSVKKLSDVTNDAIEITKYRETTLCKALAKELYPDRQNVRIKLIKHYGQHGYRAYMYDDFADCEFYTKRLLPPEKAVKQLERQLVTAAARKRDKLNKLIWRSYEVSR